MNQQEIERIDAEIEKKKQDLKDTTTRLTEAKETLGAVVQNLADARVERQKALARGDNASKLTKEIDSSMSEQALTEDLITGLEDLLKEQGEQLTALEKGRKEAFYQMTVEEISVLAGDYNSQAAKLADIVKTIWDKRLLLGWGKGKRDLLIVEEEWWENSALGRIPKLVFSADPNKTREAPKPGCFFERSSYLEAYAQQARERYVETTYPGARCLKCAFFAPGKGYVWCDRIEGDIPEEVLRGERHAVCFATSREQVKPGAYPGAQCLKCGFYGEAKKGMPWCKRTGWYVPEKILTGKEKADCLVVTGERNGFIEKIGY